jgi:hypothetical protein
VLSSPQLTAVVPGRAGTTRPIDIPAGELKALDAYAAQTGGSDLPRRRRQGLRSNGAKGELTPDNALQLLLQGTRLKIKRDGEKAVVIFVGEAAAPADEAAQRVVVVGIRRGIERNRRQEDAVGVVRRLRPNIGKLPDNSIAG